MNYAGFWPRLCAMLLDLLFLMPVIGIVYLGSEHWRLFDVYWFLPSQLIGIWYFVYLVQRLGGTPGKRVMRLTILKPDGSRIGYREAFLRNLPDLAMSLASGIAVMITVSQMSDAQYFGVAYMERQNLIRSAAPGWYEGVVLASNLWVCSEFVVMLTNRKRRALHDFIAGTVVVREAPMEAGVPVAPPGG